MVARRGFPCTGARSGLCPQTRSLQHHTPPGISFAPLHGSRQLCLVARVAGGWEAARAGGLRRQASSWNSFIVNGAIFVFFCGPRRKFSFRIQPCKPSSSPAQPRPVQCAPVQFLFSGPACPNLALSVLPIAQLLRQRLEHRQRTGASLPKRPPMRLRGPNFLNRSPLTVPADGRHVSGPNIAHIPALWHDPPRYLLPVIRDNVRQVPDQTITNLSYANAEFCPQPARATASRPHGIHSPYTHLGRGNFPFCLRNMSSRCIGSSRRLQGRISTRLFRVCSSCS